MAGGKLSPRQQMINMMYLVLTALLALNVSKEILDSFITIDKGQNESRVSVEGVLEGQMTAFQQRATDKPAKYGAKYAEAEKIQKAADDLVKKHPEPHRLKLFLQLEAKNMAVSCCLLL